MAVLLPNLQRPLEVHFHPVLLQEERQGLRRVVGWGSWVGFGSGECVDDLGSVSKGGDDLGFHVEVGGT